MGEKSELCERDNSSYTTIQLLIMVLSIMLLLLSVVIHSIVITGIARTTIVKDNGSDAPTIATTITTTIIVVRTKAIITIYNNRIIRI